jgi:CarD family transcriptional regulator
MSSVKKIGKSRKTKAIRSATKSRRGPAEAAKREPKARKARTASMPRPGRSSAKTAAKRTTSAKAKAAAHKPARASSGRSRIVAKGSTPAPTRLKKAGASRSTQVSARKPTPPARAAKGGVKAMQAPRIARAKQAVSRGKTRPGRDITAQPKLPRTGAVAPRQPASRSETSSQKAISERRAHAEAVMALRASKPAPKPHQSTTAGVTQKVQKRPEAAPQTASASAPAARTGAPAATPVAQAPAPKPAQPFDARAGDIRLPEKPGVKHAPKPSNSAKLGFKPTEFIVYPAHGVGQILTIEEQEVAGFKLELFVISFAKDKMILKVPTPKTISVGMRKLASADVVKHALNTLTGRARIKRTMWSRRAQEYEAKINSGDLVAIAEVIRDLYRSEAQPEQSYSERQLYEAALDRVAREIAVVHKLTETESLKLIESQLQKGPRRSKAEEAESDSEAGAGEANEGGITEAA